MPRTCLTRAKRLIVATACLFSFSNCAMPPEPANPRTAPASQQSESQEHRIRRLVGELRGASPEKAVRELAGIGKPAVPELLKSLNAVKSALKKDAEVARGVGVALARIGVDGKQFDSMIQLLGKKNPDGTRNAAAIALGELKNQKAVPHLIDALPEIGQSAAEAIGKIGANDEEFAALLGMLKDGSTSAERCGAASALGELGNGMAVAMLVQALASGDEALRAQAAESIGKIAGGKARTNGLRLRCPHSWVRSGTAARRCAQARSGRWGMSGTAGRFPPSQRRPKTETARCARLSRTLWQG